MTYLEKAMQMQSKPTESEVEMIDGWCPHHLNLVEDTDDRCAEYNGDCRACWCEESPDISDIEDSITPEKIEELKKEPINLSRDEITELHEIVDKAMSDTPHILDSGNRRQFETGAVRDIQEGKGRCDLMPLDVVRDFFYVRSNGVSKSADYKRNRVFGHLSNFINTGDDDSLLKALIVAEMFENPFTMILEVSKHFEEGAKKYGENNWQKGIPVHCYIDSAVRHYLKYLRGDKDEPHDRAFCWNLMCAIWTCKHKPELNDYMKGE